MRSFHSLIARRAVKEGKTNVNAVPFLFNLGLNTINVENVLALKLNTRLLVESIDVANATELFTA